MLGEYIEVELLAADSQFESQAVFDLLNSLNMGRVIAWRRMKGPARVATSSGGGVQQQGTKSTSVSAVNLAGLGERLYPVSLVLIVAYARLHSFL